MKIPVLLYLFCWPAAASAITLPVEEPAFAYPYQRCFERASDEFSLSPALILAVALGESGFDPYAVSDADAIGIMQIQWPETARELGVKLRAQLFDPCTNINLGAGYLRSLWDRFEALDLALVAYHSGPGYVHRRLQSGSGIPRERRWYVQYVEQNLQRVMATPVHNSDANHLTAFATRSPARAQAITALIGESISNTRPFWRHRNNTFEVIVPVTANTRGPVRDALENLGLTVRD